MSETRTVRLWAREGAQVKIVGGEEPAAWARARAAGKEPEGVLYDLDVPLNVGTRRDVVARFSLAKRWLDLSAQGKTIADVAKLDPELAVKFMALDGALREVARG